jgi:hypothetical protein
LASLLFSQVDDPKRGDGARIERSQSINAMALVQTLEVEQSEAWKSPRIM